MEAEEEEADSVSNLLPRDFKLIEDEERQKQVEAIQALFAEDEGEEPSIGPLFVSGDEALLSPDDVRKMQQEVTASISERGPERSRCLLKLLFENQLAGATEAPTWKQIWERCWEEPLDSRKGADVQRAANVRQAVYRVREILDRFFEGPAGRKWRVRATVEQESYRLTFMPNRREEDPGGPPMGSEEGVLEDEDS